MLQVKRRTYSGCVLEVEVYGICRQPKSMKSSAEPKLRFRDETERIAHRDNISRRKFIRIVNTNFGPNSFYITLTFNDENECHSFRDAKKLRDLYIRRIRHHYPEGRLVCVMGRGKSTDRIHLHMITEGFPQDYLLKQWTYGDISSCSRLKEHNYYDDGTGRRVDRGKDYTALAVYLWEHWKPEQGGHRWKGTRNLLPPDKENLTECKRNYSREKPPKVPEGYVLVDVQITRYGYKNFRYVMVPERQDISSKRRRL